MTTITVSSSADLLAALSSAKGGDNIVLESGNYGSVDFDNLNFSSYVTITSADGQLGATFTEIGISDSSYLRIDGVHVDNPTNGGSNTPLVHITNDSSHIEFINSEVNGKVDDVFGHVGIRTDTDLGHVTIANNYIHDLYRGTQTFGVSNVDIVGNTFNYMGDDDMKFARVNNVLVENNFGSQYRFPEEGAHDDFIQFQGEPSSNVIIRGNVLLPVNWANQQGIFLSGQGGHDNILIENNIIQTALLHGIAVDVPATNVTIRYNTVLDVDAPDTATAMTSIVAPDGSVVEYNIWTGASGSESGTNVIAQYTDPDDAYYYGDLFTGALGQFGTTLEDLIAVTGSAADGIGAVERLYELLEGSDGGETETTTTDSETTTTDSDSTTTDSDSTTTDSETTTEWKADILVRLIDTKSDQPVAEIEPGATLDLSFLDSENLSIEVVAADSRVESVRLDFENGLWSQLEKHEPYALFGDKNGDFRDSKIGALFPTAGDYELDVTLYSSNRGDGQVLGDYTLNFTVGDSGSAATESDSETTSAGTSGFARHINVGGGDYVAADGTAFEADPGISDGSYKLRNRQSDEVSGTEDDPLYQTYGFGDFSYEIAVPEAGEYAVTLYLTEPWWDSPGERLFDVALESQAIGAFDDIDLFALSGEKFEALTLTETVTVTDGVLNLDVVTLVDNGILSGFSVLDLTA